MKTYDKFHQKSVIHTYVPLLVIRTMRNEAVNQPELFISHNTLHVLSFEHQVMCSTILTFLLRLTLRDFRKLSLSLFLANLRLSLPQTRRGESPRFTFRTSMHRNDVSRTLLSCSFNCCSRGAVDFPK